MDFDPRCAPDQCVDLERELWPFADNTVEAVVAHHVMEHFGEGYFHFLKELYRVCKDGAVIDIRVPHFRHDHFFNDPTHKRAITPDGLRLFGKRYNDLCREQNTRHSLLGYYYNVDFEVTDWKYILNAPYDAMLAGKSAEEIDRFIAERNNVVLEYWIQVRVRKTPSPG